MAIISFACKIFFFFLSPSSFKANRLCATGLHGSLFLPQSLSLSLFVCARQEVLIETDGVLSHWCLIWSFLSRPQTDGLFWLSCCLASCPAMFFPESSPPAPHHNNCPPIICCHCTALFILGLLCCCADVLWQQEKQVHFKRRVKLSDLNHLPKRGWRRGGGILCTDHSEECADQ